MYRRTALGLIVSGALAFAAACNQSGTNPASPSAAGGIGGSPQLNDPVTLKATMPTVATPGDGTQVDSANPTLTVVNATGSHVALPGDSFYRFLVHDPSGVAIADDIVPQGNGSTSYRIEAAVQPETVYSWYARVEASGRTGPWTGASTFVGPPARAAEPTPDPGGGGGDGGPVGANRNIDINELVAIVEEHQRVTGADIGPNSTRESRTDWWYEAMAAVVYGHPQFNPQGGDPKWCVKTNPSGTLNDDVAVICSTREAWDCVVGIGGSSPAFHPDPIGTLPGDQPVFPPPRP